MFVFEKRIIEFVESHINVICFFLITLFALAIRYCGRNFLSGDMEEFLLPWVNEYSTNGGLKHLSVQVGDYSLLYQTFLALVSGLKMSYVYSIKLLSILFDFCLAIAAVKIFSDIKAISFFSLKSLYLYSAILCLPTVFLNSSFWGQCDSIYTFFGISTLYSIYKKHYISAFILLGLGFASKLQIIFVLPFIILIYLKCKKFSISNFAISLLIVWVAGSVAFLFGRDLIAPFSIYLNQANGYNFMFLNFPSFWQIVGCDYYTFNHVAILFTFVILGIGCFYWLKFKPDMNVLDNPGSYYKVAIWFVWTSILFLPCMHDRYAYMLDVLLVVCAFIDSRYYKFACLACLVSLHSYSRYLFLDDIESPMRLNALVYTLGYLYYSFVLYTKETKEIAA